MSTKSLSTSSITRRCSGWQPQYFPRLYFFNRILNADIYLVRDDVQYVRVHKFPDGSNRPSYQAHTPVKTNNGTLLLSVPVKHDGFKPLCKTLISYEQSWIDKHLKNIYFAYQKTPHFGDIYPDLEAILAQQYESLTDLNLQTIMWAIAKLGGLETKGKKGVTLREVNSFLENQTYFRLKEIRLASETDYFKQYAEASANEKIAGLYKEVGANEDYCGGTAMDAYMDEKFFAEKGISVVVQDWLCPEYPQAFTSKLGFIPNLTVFDLLMNVPMPEARNILKG